MTLSGPTAHAVVVYESMFGNTAAVAAAVARGLVDAGVEATCVDVREAAGTLIDDADLLVVGAPTHAFSLSRANTRAGAVRQGADADKAGRGLREWIGTLNAGPIEPRMAVFDTRARQVRRWPIGAGPTAARLARRRGFDIVDKPMTFVVEDTQGPLRAGEVERAVTWGRSLAPRVRTATHEHQDGTGR